ncbi:hypothetical protein ANCCEY_01228 [Ancylostoma ceylanicum]|uniref:Uncharacterized protein n=2 Tax=Ancylostoma ceylanicum TaxID=53326 RepID=A0A0D6M6A3_9BILA|nr:hypothetical protein ANCCEY_01228 [Ancylostoma ceylanicum]EYB86296.1 hypothetical protein Y032_0282g1293 [Ancylostoma ceylanicum]
MDDILVNGGFPPKYRCTNYSRTAEEPSMVLGIYCIVFGTVFITLYLICLAALIQRDLRALPVYKIMIFLSICDIAMLISNSIFTGFFFIKGVVFCTSPYPIYLLGCLTNSCWGASCFGGLCLVFTRLVDLWSRRLHEMLFGGKRAFVVIFLCILYALNFFFFPSPGLFNAKYYSWIYDPMINDSQEVFQGDNSWIIAGNNLLTVTSTFALYIAFFLSFLYKYHHTFAYRMASYEKQMFIQSCAISGVNVSLALIYVYMLYFPVPVAVTIAGLVLWQFSSAGAVVVYMVINKTVRRKVLRMFSKGNKKNITMVSTISTFR